MRQGGSTMRLVPVDNCPLRVQSEHPPQVAPRYGGSSATRLGVVAPCDGGE